MLPKTGGLKGVIEYVTVLRHETVFWNVMIRAEICRNNKPLLLSSKV